MRLQTRCAAHFFPRNTPGQGGVGPLHRRHLHQLRRKRVRRDVDSYDRCTQKQYVAFIAPKRVTLIIPAARLPRAKYDEDTGKVSCSRHDRVPLVLTNLPIAMSFGVFNGCVTSSIALNVVLTKIQRHHHVRPHLFRGAVDGHQRNGHSRSRRGRPFRHTGGYGWRRGPRRFMHSKRVEAAILSGRIYL